MMKMRLLPQVWRSLCIPSFAVARNCGTASRSLKEEDDGEAAEKSLGPLEEPAEVGRRQVQRHGIEQFEAAGEGVLGGVGRLRQELLVSVIILVSRAGLEPATLCLKGTCSTT